MSVQLTTDGDPAGRAFSGTPNLDVPGDSRPSREDRQNLRLHNRAQGPDMTFNEKFNFFSSTLCTMVEM